MARHPSSGELRRTLAGEWTTVIRACGRRRSFRLPTCASRVAASERSRLLANFAKRFAVAGTNPRQETEALHLIAGAAERNLSLVLMAAEDLLDGVLDVRIEQSKVRA